MKARWFHVWKVTYSMKRGGTGGAWDPPEEEHVLAGKDGTIAVQMLQKGLMDTRVQKGDGGVAGEMAFTEFRLQKLEHLCRVALFEGVVPP